MDATRERELRKYGFSGSGSGCIEANIWLIGGAIYLRSSIIFRRTGARCMGELFTCWIPGIAIAVEQFERSRWCGGGLKAASPAFAICELRDRQERKYYGKEPKAEAMDQVDGAAYPSGQQLSQTMESKRRMKGWRQQKSVTNSQGMIENTVEG